MIVRRRAPAIALLCGATLFGAATSGSAQTEVGVRAATLGLGAELGVRPLKRLGLRVAIHRFNLTREDEIEGIPYELSPRLSSLSGSVDFYPFGKVLFLSAGLLQNDNAATADAVIGSSITIGDRTYTSSQVQALGGRLDWTRSMAPWAGLGLTSGGRVGVVFETGVVFSGVPRVSLAGITTLTGPERAAFDAAVDEEEAEVRAWLDDNKKWTRYYPVVALGLRVRF